MKYFSISKVTKSCHRFKQINLTAVDKFVDIVANVVIGLGMKAVVGCISLSCNLLPENSI
jgi:hypothetical protein